MHTRFKYFAVTAIIAAAIVFAFAAGFACDLPVTVGVFHTSDYMTAHYDPGGIITSVVFTADVNVAECDIGHTYTLRKIDNQIETPADVTILPDSSMTGHGAKVAHAYYDNDKSADNGANLGHETVRIVMRC